MLALWYVVMVVGLGGMIWCVKNQKRIPNSQLYAILCLALVVLSMVMALVTFFSNPEEARMVKNARQFELAKLQHLAKYANENFAGKNVLILARTDIMKDQEGVLNQVAELKKMLKGVNVLDTVAIKITDPSEIPMPAEGQPMVEIPTPEMELNAIAFNTKFKEAKALKPDLIINLAGLPMMPEDSAKLSIWRWKKGSDPQIIFSEVTSLPDSNIFASMKDGVTASFIARSNNSNFDPLKDSADEDLLKAYDQCFITVTVDNANELIKNGVVFVPEMPRR